MYEIITRSLSLVRRCNRYTVLSLGLYLTIGTVLYYGIAKIDYHWRWGRIWRHIWHQTDGEWGAGILVEGMVITLKLSLLSGFGAILIGIIIVAGRLSTRPSLRGLAVAYLQIIRCTPLLVQLYLLYFMLATVIGLERFSAGVVVLSLFEAAFAAEIFRAGILAVGQGQIDVARALGFSRWHCQRFIIIPQALPLILPPLANLLVSLIKHSSIVTIIAVADLTNNARNLVAETFLAFEVWFIVGALYVLICFPLAWTIGRWELRLRRRGKRS